MNKELIRDINGCTDDMATMLKLVPLGYTKGDIVTESGIKIDTVKGAIKALYDLFNVNSFAQLTRVSIYFSYFVETKKW